MAKLVFDEPFLGAPLGVVASMLGVDKVKVWQVPVSLQVGVRVVKGSHSVSRLFSDLAWWKLKKDGLVGEELKGLAWELEGLCAHVEELNAPSVLDSGKSAWEEWSAAVPVVKGWGDPASDPIKDIKAFAAAFQAEPQVLKVDPVRWPHVDELSVTGRVVVGEWLVRSQFPKGESVLHAPLDPGDSCWVKVVPLGVAWGRAACDAVGENVRGYRRPGVAARRGALRCPTCSWRVGLLAGGVGSPVFDKVAAEILGLEYEPGVEALVGSGYILAQVSDQTVSFDEYEPYGYLSPLPPEKAAMLKGTHAFPKGFIPPGGFSGITGV